jgi:hypothetical protein
MWEITKEFNEDGSFKEVKIKSCGHDGRTLTEQFRMYDDDGILCYEGASNDSESEAGFDPLDDYGTPNFGCTEIRYLREGEWVTL